MVAMSIISSLRFDALPSLECVVCVDFILIDVVSYNGQMPLSPILNLLICYMMTAKRNVTRHEKYPYLLVEHQHQYERIFQLLKQLTLDITYDVNFVGFELQ